MRAGYLGLKPQAESCSPFGTKPGEPSGTKGDLFLADQRKGASGCDIAPN